MGIFWKLCFLCHGKGRLDIGDNFNPFVKHENIKCPMCKGHGELAIKLTKENPWEKYREDFL
jgi:DnaJ-class molecular chaperone